MPERASVRRDRANRPRLYGDIITVLVGSTRKLHIHAELASQHSSFFKTALEKREKEAEEINIHLPDLLEGSAEVFEDFLLFLYTGKFYSGHQGEANSPRYDEEWGRLKYSWILGEVLASVTFKGAVTDAIIDKIAATGYYPEDSYLGIYLHSSTNSSIRKLMDDIAVRHWEEERFANVGADVDHVVNARFLQDVAVAFSKLNHPPRAVKQADTPFKLQGGYFYHEHGGGKPCCKTLYG